MGLLHTRSYRDELVASIKTLTIIRHLMFSQLLETTRKLPDVEQLIDLINCQIKDSYNNLDRTEADLVKGVRSAQNALDNISKRYGC